MQRSDAINEILRHTSNAWSRETLESYSDSSLESTLRGFTPHKGDRITHADSRVSRADGGGGYGGSSYGDSVADANDEEFLQLCRRFDASQEFLEDFASADPWKVGALSARNAATVALNAKIGGGR